MNKYTFTFLIYLILLLIGLIIQSIEFSILITILVAYIFITLTAKPKWINVQLFGILLAFIYILLASKPIAHFGFTLGNWSEFIVEFTIIALVMLTVPRLIDYKTKGKLVFQPMKFRTVLSWLVIVGFGEELLFRGIIQSEFGFWTATVSFGLIHAFNLISLVKEKRYHAKHLLIAIYFVVVTGATGAVFGYLYHISGSIILVGLLHGLFDLLNHLFPPEKDVKGKVHVA